MKDRVMEEVENEGRRNVLIKHGLLQNYYLVIPKVVMADRELSLQAKVIFAVILDFIHTDGRGEIFPSQTTLCRRLNISRPTLKKYLDELREKGYLSWEKRGLPARNFYVLNIPHVNRQRFDIDTWGINPELVNAHKKIADSDSDATENDNTGLQQDANAALQQDENAALHQAENSNTGLQLVDNTGLQLVDSQGLQLADSRGLQHNKSNITNLLSNNKPATKVGVKGIVEGIAKSIRSSQAKKVGSRDEFVEALKEMGFSEEEIGEVSDEEVGD